VKHADLIFACSEPAMEMACSRLADAANRTKPQDRIVDAVIGMEAILLAGLGNEEGRGELSFRFSLNYSTLFKTPEDRQHGYRVARDLYRLRSIIAHGTSLDEENLKIAGAKPKLPEAGRIATSALRRLIMHFLPKNGAPYKDHKHWQRTYFGFPDGE
jgi:hypothetical protein